jgi:hypothetical protein
MSQNRVQFQEGLSWEAFNALYGTEEQCISVVFKMRFPQGFICEECGHSDGYRELKNGRVMVCNHCYHRTFLTAGTIFQDSKLPLTKWFLAIHLLTKDKQGISALQLKRELGVHYETAWQIKQKLMVVMEERNQEKKLESDAVADDVYFGGKKSGRKGRGALGKVPAVVALSLTEDGKPDQMKANVVSGFSLKALEQWAHRSLAKGIHLDTDGLACFPAVRQAGIGHDGTNMSKSPNSQDEGCFQWINTIIGNLKTAITGTYHHVSEKYLERYLAEFTYRFNRRYDLRQMVARFAYVALRTPPFPESFLKLEFSSR